MRTQIFTALLPLVLFWIVEEFFGLKVALVVGCVAAVLELGLEKYFKKRISFMTWASNGLILGLGAVSLWMNSGLAFKLQPMVMELSMAALMAVLRLTGGEPFMLRVMRDAPFGKPGQKEFLLKQPWFTQRLQALDTHFILFLVCHGLAVGWAAVWGSTRLWILLKGVLFYVLMVLVMIPSMRYKPSRGIPDQTRQ